ncbi:YfcC family protein [Aminobacterium sp. UBA5514]|uniref:YfcC family protein n=3 Tax=Aminobacteriaceae TaxID=3029087 RepID=UPI0032E4920A
MDIMSYKEEVSTSSTLPGEKKKFKLPHVFVLLFLMICFAAFLTHILPAGQFDRQALEIGLNQVRQVLVPGSYHTVEPSPVGPFETMISIYKGMVAAADIIFLVFLPYASFCIVVKTGAMNSFVSWLLHITKGKDVLLIPLFSIVFSLGASLFGMFSEFYGFIPLFVGLAIALGYDAMVGLAIVGLSTGIGFAASMTNPYTVGIAQKVSEVPLFSGLGFRFFHWALFTAIAIWWTLRYARKVKRDPSTSLVNGTNYDHVAMKQEDIENNSTSWRDRGVLSIVAVTMVLLVYGTLKRGWGFNELCGLFLSMGILSGLTAGWSPNRIAKEYSSACSDVVGGAFVVGLARGVLVVLADGNVIDTVIYGLSLPLSGLPRFISAQGMLFTQTLINFFIPSGSGQAATTMPIMAPLADILGVTRQTAILAFQYGDGFSNLLFPTSANIVIMCGIAHVTLEQWWKFFIPLFGLSYLVQMGLLVLAQLTGY